METPEKDNFLETIRELRREADEKLTGNRHYLAIQKLDEIAEAVQQRDMSSEELGAVSNVLRGDNGGASQAVEEEAVSIDEPVDLAVPAAGVAGAAIAAEAITSDEPAEVVMDQQTAEQGAEQVLPNWWKDKEEGDAPAEPSATHSEPAPAPEIETIAESVEEGSPDLISAATGAAVTGAAVAAIGDALSSKTVETPDIVEEIELVDVPEVEIDTPDVELPAINIEAIEPEVEMEEVSLDVEPEIELPEIETMAVPEIAPEPEVPEFEVAEPEVPEFEVAETAPEVEVAEIAPDVEIPEIDDVPEVAAVPETVPEPTELVVEQIAPEEVVEPIIEETALPIADDSAQIADLLFDEKGTAQAAIAAGAAAAAIGVAGSAQQDEPVSVEAPEKLSFPSVPETSEQLDTAPELASAVPAAKILNGDNIERHPTYGGNRGGILKRFANSLRGKDYI